jgi:hypothetical protein
VVVTVVLGDDDDDADGRATLRSTSPSLLSSYLFTLVERRLVRPPSSTDQMVPFGFFRRSTRNSQKFTRNTWK